MSIIVKDVVESIEDYGGAVICGDNGLVQIIIGEHVTKVEAMEIASLATELNSQHYSQIVIRDGKGGNVVIEVDINNLELDNLQEEVN